MSIRSRIAEWVMKAAPAVSYGTSDDRLAELFASVHATAAAISVTPESALRCAPVAAAVRSIADPIGALPLRLYRVGTDGSRTPVGRDEHPVANLLADAWTSWMSSQEVRRQITADALLRDIGGVGLVIRVGGQPREVIRLPPGSISVAFTALGEPRWTLSTEAGSRDLDPADVVHVPSPFSAYPSPRSPLSLCREAVALALALERHAGHLMGRGARPGGVIERTEASPARPGPEKAGQDEKRFNDTWSAFQRSGGTLILPQGAKFTSLEFKSVDLQFLEMRKFQVEEIARAFGVPPHRLYELGRATWSNVSDMGREFVDYSLSPWLRTWESALARALLTAEERRSYAIEFDTDDLTLPSLGDRAEALQKLISATCMSPNEARAWLALPPREGGDVFTNPNTTTAAAGAEKESSA